MFKYLNLHPEGKLVGDCVKRTVAKVFDKDYKEVSLELNRFKKVTGEPTFNSTKNWTKFVENLGGVKLSFPAVAGQPRMNGYSFVKEFPKGRYLLRMAKHTVACVDGVIYDTWDCRDKCVYFAYEVKL